MSNETVWIIIGFSGQALFTARFFIQWLQSERVKHSVIPAAFWYFSIAGGAVLLIYAIHRVDPVFIAGQAAGLFIYLRNLYFVIRDRHAAAADSGELHH
jgi:lipid-A-disaccharide synthase-like uncharacterized protein